MYNHLTSQKRWDISTLLENGWSRAKIADTIGVDPSTVPREINRNSGTLYLYCRHHLKHRSKLVSNCGSAICNRISIRKGRRRPTAAASGILKWTPLLARARMPRNWKHRCQVADAVQGFSEVHHDRQRASVRLSRVHHEETWGNGLLHRPIILMAERVY